MRTALIRCVLFTAMLGALQDRARADLVIQALEQRGFLPVPSIYVNRFTYEPETTLGMPLGSGYVVRLPEIVQVQQVLAISEGRSVILDITKEPGAFRLSPEAAQGLELQQFSTGMKPVHIDIIALMRSAHLQYARPPKGSSDSKQTVGPKQSPIPAAAPRNVDSSSEHAAILKPEHEPVRQESNGVVLPFPSPGAPALLALQAGYFRNEGNAKRFAEVLRKQSLPVRVVEHRNAKGLTRWRVLAGPFEDTLELEQARSKAGDLLADAYQIRMP